VSALLVHAEVVLNRDGRERLILLADMDALLGLHRLVQPVGPTTTRHQTAGEFVDDDDLAVFDDIVNIALKNRVGFESLLHVVQGIDLARIVEIVNAEQPFHLSDPGFGQRHRAAFLVDRVIALGFDGSTVFLRWIALDHRAALELGNNPIDQIVFIR